MPLVASGKLEVLFAPYSRYLFQAYLLCSKPLHLNMVVRLNCIVVWLVWLVVLV